MRPGAVRLATVDDTRAYGRELAGVLRPGDLIVLSGPLGAGKTVLAQGIGAGLEVPGEVTSPTFVIARVHRGGRLPFVHVDAYRLGSVVEVDDLDLDASVEESVTVVEWGGGIVEQLADAYLEVRIDRHDDDTREVALIPHDGDWPTRVTAIAALLVRPKCRPTTSAAGRSARPGPPDQGSAGRH